jgi:4'-phosphopantetheinyl transferase EntD
MSDERRVLEAMLPAAASVAATRTDVQGAELLEQEEEAVRDAVERRRQEFASGRACARSALQRLGLPRQAIPVGPGGEPRWPAGVVGSITHCAGYRACAVARERDLMALGIDAEPNEPLPVGILADVAFGDEPELVERLASDEPGICWDRVLFSAKEAIYKAWFPLVGRRLGFEDAALSIDAGAGTFVARLLVRGPLPKGGELRVVGGRWAVDDGIVLTAVALAR